MLLKKKKKKRKLQSTQFVVRDHMQQDQENWFQHESAESGSRAVVVKSDQVSPSDGHGAPTRVSPPRKRVSGSTRVVSKSSSGTLLLLCFFLWLCTQWSALGFFLGRRVNRFPGDGIVETGWWVEFVVWPYYWEQSGINESVKLRVKRYWLHSFTN